MNHNNNGNHTQTPSPAVSPVTTSDIATTPPPAITAPSAPTAPSAGNTSGTGKDKEANKLLDALNPNTVARQAIELYGDFAILRPASGVKRMFEVQDNETKELFFLSPDRVSSYTKGTLRGVYDYSHVMGTYRAVPTDAERRKLVEQKLQEVKAHTQDKRREDFREKVITVVEDCAIYDKMLECVRNAVEAMCTCTMRQLSITGATDSADLEAAIKTFKKAAMPAIVGSVDDAIVAYRRKYNDRKELVRANTGENEPVFSLEEKDDKDGPVSRGTGIRTNHGTATSKGEDK